MKKGLILQFTFILALSVATFKASSKLASSFETSSISINLSSLKQAQNNVSTFIGSIQEDRKSVAIAKIKLAKKALVKLNKKNTYELPISRSAEIKIEKKKLEIEKTISEVKFNQVEKIVKIEREEILKIDSADEKNEYSNTIVKSESIEITTGEKIKLIPIKINTIKTESLASLFVPIQNEVISVNEILAENKNNNKDEKNKEDRISMAQAANETSIIEIAKIVKAKPSSEEAKKVDDVKIDDYSSLIEEQKNLPLEVSQATQKAGSLAVENVAKTVKRDEKKPASTDELVFFDYSQKEEESSKKLEKWEAVKKIQPKKTNPIFANLTPPEKVQKSDFTKNEYSNFVADNSKAAERFEYSFSVKRISAPNKLVNQSSYEFDFRDDYNERTRSNSEGQIVLKGKTSSKNIRRISIFGKDLYPTTLDQMIVAGREKIGLKVFGEAYIGEIFRKNNLRGIGGHVFVELDSITEDVELDIEVKYEKKIYLDSQYRAVEKSESDYDYILFAGVRPGNTVIRFKTYKNEQTTKIIHVSDREIYYDANYYEESRKDSFSLFEEHILSKNVLPLDVDTQKIIQFSQNTEVVKNALGQYYFPKTLYSTTTRKYLELNHLSETIFIGYLENNKIVVPSENYIQVILDKFGIGDLKNQCVIQLNINKKAKDISIEGLAASGATSLDFLMLDEDGIFYEEFTSGTKRVFIHGQEQGIINIKLKYNDGSEAYQQSYCSSNTYLVEQL